MAIVITSREKLTLDQNDIHIKKHAIKCRVNTENTLKYISPNPGNFSLYCQPGSHGIGLTRMSIVDTRCKDITIA